MHGPWVGAAALRGLCLATAWKFGCISRYAGFYLFTSSPSSQLQTGRLVWESLIVFAVILSGQLATSEFGTMLF